MEPIGFAWFLCPYVNGTCDKFTQHGFSLQQSLSEASSRSEGRSSMIQTVNLNVSKSVMKRKESEGHRDVSALS